MLDYLYSKENRSTPESRVIVWFHSSDGNEKQSQVTFALFPFSPYSRSASYLLGTGREVGGGGAVSGSPSLTKSKY